MSLDGRKSYRCNETKRMAVDLTMYFSFTVGELRWGGGKTAPPWGRLGEARSRVSKVDSGLSVSGTHPWSSAFAAASRT